MTALITGASSGIGRDMAVYLSELGYNLILTGRNKQHLLELQSSLKTKSIVVVSDLSKPDAPYKLYDFCKKYRVDMLINNAGFGLFGKFEDVPLDDELTLLDVNIKAVHILTKLFLKDFKIRNSGCILNVSSIAGFMSGPLLSSYYASKNYVLRLSLAVHEELRREKSKVKISVLCPGPVDTEFNERAGVKFSIKPMSSKKVAKYAIDKALKGQLIIIPGIAPKLCVLAGKFLPAPLFTSFTYNVQKAKMK